jgi:hypothetical protein
MQGRRIGGGAIAQERSYGQADEREAFGRLLIKRRD